MNKEHFPLASLWNLAGQTCHCYLGSPTHSGRAFGGAVHRLLRRLRTQTSSCEFLQIESGTDMAAFSQKRLADLISSRFSPAPPQRSAVAPLCSRGALIAEVQLRQLRDWL